MKTAGIIKIIVGCVVLAILLTIGAGILTGANIYRGGWWKTGRIELKAPQATAQPASEPARAEKTQAGSAEAPAAADAGSAETPAEAPAAGELRYAASEVRDIEITWIAGSVRIVAGTGEEITVAESCDETLADDQQMRCRLKDGKLSIHYCDDIKDVWRWFSIGSNIMPPKDLIVTLPASLAARLEDLDVETVSAKLEISGLDCRELSISTTSGNVTTADCRAAELDISTVSGSAEITGAFTDVDFESVSGGLKLVCTAAPQQIDTETVSGKVDVTLPADAEFTATLDAVSGELSSEFPCSVSKDRLICGSGANRYEFQSVSGDVHILMAK